MVKGESPHCAMMQVAAEDTHDNYVVCRGFDPRIKRFIDYDEEDLEAKPGVPVAKPYGKRHTNPYVVGEMFAAFLPLVRIGKGYVKSQNPGVRPTPAEGEPDLSSGQPEDLDEELEILYTDEEEVGDRKVINWCLVDEGGGSDIKRFELMENFGPYVSPLGGGDYPHYAEAREIRWVPFAGDYVLSPFVGGEDVEGAEEFGPRFTVRESMTHFKGRPKSVEGTGDGVDHGSYGLCSKLSAPAPDGQWSVLHLQPLAHCIRCTVTSALVYHDTTTIEVSVEEVLYPLGGILLKEVTSVENLLSLPSYYGATLIAFYVSATDKWVGVPAFAVFKCTLDVI